MTPSQESRGAGWVWAQGLLMTALVVSGPFRSGDWHAPASVAVGVLLLVAGGFLGVAGVVHLGGNRTPFPRPKPGSSLVQRGVYDWVRHPLYLSVMLVGISWALLWQSSATLALAVAQCVFFDFKARQEEQWLRVVFPEYEEYARQVKRFVPGLY